jgi:hypothetical protein
MKQIINDREEALVAHKSARTRIANQKQLSFTPFLKKPEGMAWHKESKDESLQKNCSEM